MTLLTHLSTNLKSNSILNSIYRRVRPWIANTYSSLHGQKILTRSDILENPPSNISIYQYGDSEEYIFSKPQHFGDLPEVIKKKIGKQTVPAPFIVEVKDATGIGPSGIVISDGNILLESVLGGYERLIDASAQAILSGQMPFESQLQRPIQKFDEPVFSLVGPWATDYYHWIADYLVQILAIEVYRNRTSIDPKIMVPADPPRWLRDSLRLAGIAPEKTIEWSDERAKFRRLVLGSARYHTESEMGGHIHSPSALNQLGTIIRNGVKDVKGVSDNDQRRLYVSRMDASDRRVLNEHKLMPLLEENGFERIVPGRLPFAEQVRQFANAEIILGPHGAGLTNMIFSEKTTLIELFGRYENACFFTLAKGLNYNYVSVSTSYRGENLIVDVDMIQRLLRDIL